MNERVDVVIPVRDVDRYLEEAIDSALTQTGVDCRVVVVDAGSVEPVRLVPRHRHPAVRLIRSDEPLLAGAARNLGADETDAPWLTFLDGDDRWPAGSRRGLVDACTAAPADLAVGMLTAFHADEAARRLRLPEGPRRALVAGGVLLSRHAWEVVGPFDPGLRSGEFIEWHNRFRQAGLSSAEIDDIVLERRVHVDSTTANQIHDRSDYLEVVRRWMSRTD